MKSIEMSFCASDYFYDIVAHHGEVAHLATRAGFAFIVEVELAFGVGEEGGPVGGALLPKVAEQIDHDGGAV
jgi:hypothetical protein